MISVYPYILVSSANPSTPGDLAHAYGLITGKTHTPVNLLDPMISRVNVRRFGNMFARLSLTTNGEAGKVVVNIVIKGSPTVDGNYVEIASFSEADNDTSEDILINVTNYKYLLAESTVVAEQGYSTTYSVTLHTD